MRTKPTVITRRAGNVLVHQRQWLGQRNTAKDNFWNLKEQYAISFCQLVLCVDRAPAVSVTFSIWPGESLLWVDNEYTLQTRQCPSRVFLYFAIYATILADLLFRGGMFASICRSLTWIFETEVTSCSQVRVVEEVHMHEGGWRRRLMHTVSVSSLNATSCFYSKELFFFPQ